MDRRAHTKNATHKESARHLTALYENKLIKAVR